MSETVNTIILDALQLLGIQATEEPLENADAQTAIRTLNRMMAAWESQGISLEYTATDSVDDDVDVDDGAYEGIVSNLATKLAPYYEKEISGSLRELAKEGLDAILQLTIVADMDAAEFPDTLPTGAGNYDNFNTGGDAFYPDYEDDILGGTL